MTVRLQPAALTAAAFAAFGDVIALPEEPPAGMNAGHFQRTVGLARIDAEPPAPAEIDIVRCVTTTALPHRFDTLERHPLGSQAFVPLAPFAFVVVVAAAGETIDPQAIHAFVTDGTQGINYRRGTWHLPLIARAGQVFLVIERADRRANCEVRRLAEPLVLEAPA